ncbi:Fic family protein [Chitinophaga eiseniae]|uniref:Fic family protein n=1 Tax=Chitinophaga eiseniae TaxID=634771 RepID=A0A1T4KMS2_9BACT|nr:Fic family protein [Chitinophaga eiseniae]SJZ43704.1 Fic family protein [Chitinophaga eiseniae]
MRASQETIDREMEVIRKALEKFKDGVSIEGIKKETGLDLERRTLLRRLDKLVEQGIVTTSGRTRAMLYRLAELPAHSTEEKDNKAANGAEADIIPLSDEGREILAAVSRSTAVRHPVGYNTDFLRGYRPNVDSYLSPEDKRKLAELGKTAKLNQPAGTYAKEILQRLLIDLSWNSSRLEGNTYSLLDTQQLISQGKAADNKSAMEAQMILNHKDAIEFIVQSAEEIGFNRYTITNLHALLSNNLLADPGASGRLRSFGVGIGNSVYTPLGIPQQIEEMFEIMLEKAREIADPFEQAFFIMVQLPYLQSFDDVNKRVSRLAANIPLNRLNLAPLAFVDVPEDMYVKGMLGVYELNRIELFKDVFIWAYERSALRYAALRQSLGEPDPFRLKYRDEIRALVTEIVSNAMTPDEAAIIINAKSLRLPIADQRKFVETVDTELLSLHDGNFARYYIRPAEFEKWKEVWRRK